MRTAFSTFLLLALLATQAAAQDWARKMFTGGKLSHDFGDVARGAKAVCVFELKNLYKENVHIAGVKSSCGCTTPTVSQHTLRTYETAEIIAQLNTTSFLGEKSATITVAFDQPFAAEVRLQVKGNIRGDVAFTPGVVQFGAVDQGQRSEQRVAVSHQGRDNFTIVDVQSTYEHVEVELEELGRGGGQVRYELLVRLTESAPAGYLNEQLVLVTADGSTTIPLSMEGRIVPDVTVTPTTLYLGEVAAGETVTKKVVVRGKRPFRILNLDCKGDCFDFEVAADEAKPLHVVTLKFKAGKAGLINERINILTDRNNGVTTSLVAHAQVIE